MYTHVALLYVLRTILALTFFKVTVPTYVRSYTLSYWRVNNNSNHFTTLLKSVNEIINII